MSSSLKRTCRKPPATWQHTQPGASGRIREGLAEMQQNEAKLRMQYSARWIRQGQGGYMVPREAPITQTMDKVAKDLSRPSRRESKFPSPATATARRSGR